MLRISSRKLLFALTLAALAAPGVKLLAQPAPITGTDPEPQITGTDPEPQSSIFQMVLSFLHLA
jgi:hypothetical protein